jgi:hypothetical protein
MTADEGSIVFDVRFLSDATRKLHGYLLYNWFTQYLGLIVENTRRLMRNGVLGPQARPTPETDYAVVFDIHALDLKKLSYVLGFYFYVLSSHKKANYYLMQENDRRRVLYLQGFDYYRRGVHGHRRRGGGFGAPHEAVQLEAR